MKSSTYNFSAEAAQSLQKLMERMDIPEEEVIRQALSLLSWAVREHDQGTKILVARPTVIATLPFLGEIKGEAVNQILFSMLDQLPAKD
jgi:hypothetical protein